MHNPKSSTVHKQFHDSKYPLYPIPSKYVDDEVLVIINTPKEEEKEEKPKLIGHKKHD